MKNFRFFIFTPKAKKTPVYRMKKINNNDAFPKIIITTLEDIAPQNPKKFTISCLPTILPNPGSLELYVKILIIKNREKIIRNTPRKSFNNNNLKLP